MRKYLLGLMTLACTAPLLANELSFDWSQMPTNQPPEGCISTLTGDGKPGAWKIITDEVPLLLPPLSPNAPTTAPKSVVAQLAWDAADNHYPLLVLGTNFYGDFTFTTRFKMADGLTEQIAGVAFRMQDEQNYYVIRASATSGTFYFYRVFKGQFSAPIGNNIKFTRGEWHQLTVDCAGPKIHILLDGKEGLPMLTDPTFAAGKIAFFTKSDSISYFTETHLTYTPRESFAQLLVRDSMKDNPRLLGVKIYMPAPGSTNVQLIASNDQKEIGQPGEKIDADVIDRGVNYFSKDKDDEIVYVTMPLRDRNGDSVASVRFEMKSFKGQTEENAVIRATPILKKMQERAASVDRLY